MRPTSDHCLLYVTCADTAEAERIAAALLEAGHIACANILPPIRSLYRWQGQTCNEQETAMLLKTRYDCIHAVSAQIQQLHSYDTPCIVTLPLTHGHPPFLAWIDAALAEQKP